MTGATGPTGATGSTTTFVFVAPTNDPHVLNSLWNNGGTLTISGG
jgi:hypothetical protein